MKSILMSIRPQWVAKILNGNKTVEIRKKFPKDYVGWVYIYVTKSKLNLVYDQDYDDKNQTWKKGKYELVDYGDKYSLNGKVVARFWCDKVEEIECNWHCDAGNCYDAETFYEHDLLEHSCLSYKDLDKYLQGKKGKAIHITNLEIFDKPNELEKFKIRKNNCPFPCSICNVRYCRLTKAPQSWCYIEGD